MTIPITGQPPVPSLSEPDTFNTKALNLFTWQTGSMLDQFNNVNVNDFFAVQSSIDDTDTSKVMKVGAFGLGSVYNGLNLANIDDSNTPSGLYRAKVGTTTGTFPANVAVDSTVLIMRSVSTGYLTQTIVDLNGRSFFRGVRGGVWGVWYESAETNNPTFTGTGTKFVGGFTSDATIYIGEDHSTFGHRITSGGTWYSGQTGIDSKPAVRFYRDGGIAGIITTTGSSTTYGTTSDYRLKTEIESPAAYDPTALIDDLASLQKWYSWNLEPAKTELGWYAHELGALVPRAVTGEKDGVDEDGNDELQSRSDTVLIPDIVAALAKAQDTIRDLQARLVALETA